MNDYDGPIGEYPPITRFDVDPTFLDQVIDQTLATVADILGLPWITAQ